jgi:hypothetical protein
MSNRYASGQLVTLSCVFTVSGAVADPTVVSASIRFGTASTLSYGFPTAAGNTALIKDSKGIYHFDFTPISAGTYYYRFQGFQSCQAAEEGNFDCVSARF